MAAPRNPNVSAAAGARRRIGDAAAASRLHASGWAVIPPDAVTISEASVILGIGRRSVIALVAQISDDPALYDEDAEMITPAGMSVLGNQTRG